MRKEIGDQKLIQDLFHTQVDTLILQAEKSVFRVSVGEEAKNAPPTNLMPHLIFQFSVERLHHINGTFGHGIAACN